MLAHFFSLIVSGYFSRRLHSQAPILNIPQQLILP